MKTFREMKIRHVVLILLAACALPLLPGCSDEDDGDTDTTNKNAWAPVEFQFFFIGGSSSGTAAGGSSGG